MRHALIALSLLLAAPAALAGESAAEQTHSVAPDSPVGRSIDDFTLRDFRGKPLSLSDLEQSRIVVVAFIGVDCPLVRLYGPQLQAMSETL